MEKQYYETVDVRTGSLPLSPTDRTISEIVPVITNGDDCIQSAYYNFSFRHWANLSGELLDVTHWLRPVNLSQDKCYIIFNDDKVNSILSAALQNLSTEQLEVLRDCLIERTPKKVNLSTHDREQWVSVEDRLPENNVWVLAAIEGVGVLTELAVYCKDCLDGHMQTTTGWLTSCSGSPETRITHWMPLPKEPNDERSVANADAQ